LGVVARSLDVGFREWFTQALDNRLELVFARSDSHGENVSYSKVHCLLVDVVLKNNETSVEQRNIGVEDGLEFAQSGFTGRAVSGNVPVGGVKVGCGVVDSDRGPQDRSKAHLCGDGSDSVVDISIGRSESVGSDTGNVPDDLGGPSELGDDLLVGQSREHGVRPCVDRELVAGYVFGEYHFRSRQDSRADDKEGGLEVVGV